MIFAKLGRAFSFALMLVLGTTNSLLSHALPGTIVTLVQNENELSIAIEVNLEDLIIAEPALEPLETMANGALKPQELTEALAHYFNSHMKLSHEGANIFLALKKAHLGTKHDDHVGQYALLTLKFLGELEGNAPVKAMTLKYDAVLHEVRSHRAFVFWADASAGNRLLAQIRFRTADSQPAPIVLNIP